MQGKSFSWFAFELCSWCLAVPLYLGAAGKKDSQVGYLSQSDSPTSTTPVPARRTPLVQGLRELGYRRGEECCAIDFHYSEESG